jgi:hypothetical protein
MLPLRMRSPRSFETSTLVNQATQCKLLGDLNVKDTAVGNSDVASAPTFSCCPYECGSATDVICKSVDIFKSSVFHLILCSRPLSQHLYKNRTEI